MKKNFNRKFFDTQILRTPFLPLVKYKDIPADENKVKEFVKVLYRDANLREAIYLSSPELFAEWKKVIESNQGDKPFSKIDKSIIKYYIRSITNCIPFGLFATYSILHNQQPNFDSENIEIVDRYFTSINVQFLLGLVNQLNRNVTIRKTIKYNLNDTLYKVGNSYRFVEFLNTGSNSRKYTLSSIAGNPVFDLIISKGANGFYYKQLLKFLTENVEDLADDVAEAYINDLIESNILVSSLAFSLNGTSPIKQLISFFNDKLTEVSKIDSSIDDYKRLLECLSNRLQRANDQSVSDVIELYELILLSLKPYNIEFNIKNLFSKNTQRTFLCEATSDSHNVDTLNQAIDILKLLSTIQPEKRYRPQKNLNQFKKNFIERYGNDTPVPLLVALDSDIGIGYIKQDKNFNNFSSLLDDLRLPSIEAEYYDVSIDKKLDEFWIKQIFECINSGTDIIDLSKVDLSGLEKTNNPLCGTFNLLYSKIGEKYLINSAGGTNGGRYIGRFGTDDNEIEHFLNEISKEEKAIFNNQLCAEIIHLPGNNIGNVTVKNIKRDYQIPILAHSSEDTEAIFLNDLSILIRNNKVVLFSNTHQKEVIPFLTSAQNFHFDSLPIYHFLCDMQFQSRENHLALDMTEFLSGVLPFIPRITYGQNIVLSPAKWILDSKEISSIINLTPLTPINFQVIRDHKKIPRFVNVYQMSGEPLIIDLENEFLLSILKELLSNQKKVILTEVLYDIENAEKNQYATEYIATFSESGSIGFERYVDSYANIANSFMPGDDWLYFKIYTSVNFADVLLCETIPKLVENTEIKSLVDRWFFIRYSDPEFHVRIRFHLKDRRSSHQLINNINKWLKQYLQDKLVWKIELSTYERELQRYFGSNIEVVESIFHIDSEFVVALLSHLIDTNQYNQLWIYCVKSIDGYLNAALYTLEEKYELMHELFQAFLKEFKGDVTTRKQIDCKFRSDYDQIHFVLKLQHENLNFYDVWNASLVKSISKLRVNLSKANFSDILKSLMHMNINRQFRANQRMHEFMIYGILEKFYKKEIGLDTHLRNLTETSL